MLEALDPRLTYHNISHTLDVTQAIENIALQEEISDERTIFLLKTAALFHDTGFLCTYKGHESMSCSIFLSETKDLPLSESERLIVTDLIMATRTPQKPTTHLQSIMCDADLDYLGREDFPSISERLFTEFLNYGFIANKEEWNELQLAFLQAHHYHTHTSKIGREPLKKQYLLQMAVH